MNPLHLLAGGAALHMGYGLFPADQQALAWNALGAAARLALLAMLVYPVKTLYMGAVVAWLAAEELQVIVCNSAFMFKPWHVGPGQDVCSAWVRTDIGKLTAVSVALLLATLPSKFDGMTGGPRRG
jgi:uncharacterized membrane protein